MNIALIGFAFFSMLALMLIGMPIAVSMAAVGIIGGIAAYGVPFMDSIAPVVWGVQNESLLTSVPLFVLLGELLLRSGIADSAMYMRSAIPERSSSSPSSTNSGMEVSRLSFCTPHTTGAIESMKGTP